AGGLGQIHPPAQFGDADAAITGQFCQDFPVDLVQLAHSAFFHGPFACLLPPVHIMNAVGSHRSGQNPAMCLAYLGKTPSESLPCPSAPPDMPCTRTFMPMRENWCTK